MPNSPFIAHIEEPCHELWSRMAVTERGRFCSNCQKEVTDLTDLSDAQAMEVLQSGGEQQCVRMRADQLNRDLSALPTPVGISRSRNAHWLTHMAAACIALVPLHEVIIKSPIKITHNAVVFTPDEVLSNIQVSDNGIQMTGVVYRSFDKQGLPNAKVAIKGTDIVTTTNDRGEFSLSFSLSADAKHFVLVCSREHFSEVERVYDTQKLPKKLWIEMEYHMIVGKAMSKKC